MNFSFVYARSVAKTFITYRLAIDWFSFFQLAEGKYDVQITLTEALDYERRNSYLINLVAIDGASDPLKRLQAKATVAVDVLDVQVNNRGNCFFMFHSSI